MIVAGYSVSWFVCIHVIPDSIILCCEFLSLYQVWCMSVIHFLSYMNMLAPIVLVVVRRSFTNKLWICCCEVHCCAKFHKLFIFHWIWMLYVPVCKCIIQIVTTLLSPCCNAVYVVTIDSVLVPCVVCVPYTEWHEHNYPYCSRCGMGVHCLPTNCESLVVRLLTF